MRRRTKGYLALGVMGAVLALLSLLLEGLLRLGARRWTGGWPG